MQITKENVEQFLVTASDVKENLELVETAAQEWLDAEDQDSKRDARQELEETLEMLDIATLCQMVHGKHRAVKVRAS